MGDKKENKRVASLESISIHLKQLDFTTLQLVKNLPKIACGIKNSADPDQFHNLCERFASCYAVALAVEI